jgi:hypothetical protein
LIDRFLAVPTGILFNVTVWIRSLSDGSIDIPWPTGPFVTGRGGSGGGDSWEMDYWMWPLPPEGSLTFVASWPAYGVSESTAELDATEIRARAWDAEMLWSD